MATDKEDEDLDFLGDSSMKNLALRMDEIDKEIAAISEVGKEKPKSQGSGELDTAAEGEREFYDTPEKPSKERIVEDLVFEDSDVGDEEDAGLEDLQNDLKEFDASNPAHVQSETPTSVTVTVVKPEMTSSIGISMKTSKGITRIVAVNPAGLLAGSELQPGYQLIKVNGTTIRTAKHAKRVIEDTDGSVTLHALVPQPPQ